jgi:hypothetical protein
VTAIGNPVPGPRLGAAGGLKSKRNRQLLIYGGVGVALLVLVLLRSRGQAAGATPNDGTSSLVPVASPASDGALGSGGGVDNSAQLASFESGIMDQLPQVIAGAVQSGLANGMAGSGQVPQGSASAGGDFAAGAAFAASLIPMGVGLGGQQTGGATAATKGATGGAGKVTAAMHPALATPHAIGRGTLVRGSTAKGTAVYRATAGANKGDTYRVETRKVKGKPHIVHVYSNGHVVDMGPK